MSAVEEGYVGAAGRRTWYRVVGDLRSGLAPLVALHGGPGSTHHYFTPLERLAGDGRAVVLYDQLGCGKSDRPDDVGWSLQIFLDELNALREALSLERIHLLGSSWGGMLALEHALARQDTVASLILSSTLASAEQWAAEAKRLRDACPADDPNEFPDDEFSRRHFNRSAQRPPEITAMIRERSPAVYEAMWGPNEWTPTGALAGWDARPRLRELRLPTLVVRGRHDMCTDAIARTLVDGIPGAREVVLEESSHTPVLEETERYLEVVGAFIGEHDA